MNLPAVRQEMADQLKAALEIQVSPYMLANPTPPAGHLYPTPIEYDHAFQRGMDVWTFTLQVFVSETVDIGAQNRLDEFLNTSGPRSVKAALEADGDAGRPVLGGLVDDLRVVRCEGYRRYVTEGRGPAFGSEWTIEVYAEGGG